MSRSALWRQEGNVKERERQAEELFQLAVEEGRVSSLHLVDVSAPKTNCRIFLALTCLGSMRTSLHLEQPRQKFASIMGS